MFSQTVQISKMLGVTLEHLGLAMVMHVLNSITLEAEAAQSFEFEACQVYRLNFKTARITQRNLGSTKEIKK